jgi:hypothetical protein
MGKVMMYRLMNALGISQVKSVEELEAICLAAMRLYYPPPFFVYQFERLSDMRSGWYDALGIEAEEELGKCLKKGDNACEVVLRVNKWKKENPPI